MPEKNIIYKTIEIVTPYLAGAVAVLFWGFSFVSTTVLMDDGHLSPVEAYIYRFTLAYLLIALISHKHWFCHNWRDEALMILAGMTSGSIYFVAENMALTMTSTTNVSLLSSTSPLVTVLLVGLIYKSERPGLGVIIGSIVAFLGVICVILNSIVVSANPEALHINPFGDLLALSTAVSWAFYSMLLKKLNVVYDAMFITRKTFFYGIVTALPFLLVEPEIQNPIKALSNPVVLGNMLFLVFGASIISFYLWAKTVDKLGAVKANNYMYFQPIVTLFASMIVLNERIGILGYIGLITVIGGLWLGDYLQEKWNKKAQTPPR